MEPLSLKPATSSQRSAGTVSGGAPEVAQPERSASLKRPLLDADLSLDLDQDSQTSSQGFSKSQRSSREATPARQRATAARARTLWADEPRAASAALEESGDEAGTDSACGLEFLLRACEMLDPHAAARWALPQVVRVLVQHPWRSVQGEHCLPQVQHGAAACCTRRHAAQRLTAPLVPHPFVPCSAAARAASLPTPSKRPPASLEGTPGRVSRAARSATASPVVVVTRRPVSRRLMAREVSDDLDDDGSDYEGSGADADADYRPGGRGAARASTRAQRASARGAAAAAAATVAPAAVAPAPAPAPARGGRWGEPKALISGPCMNPGGCCSGGACTLFALARHVLRAAAAPTPARLQRLLTLPSTLPPWRLLQSANTRTTRRSGARARRSTPCSATPAAPAGFATAPSSHWW